MNVKTSFSFFSGPATLACAVMSILLTAPAQGQQSLQELHGHVRPAVARRQAEMVGSLPATQRMHLSIVLPLRNRAQLSKLLSELYDPSSSNYRQFLSVAQFTEQFGPAVEDYQAVVEFARANGFTVDAAPANHLVVPIHGSVAQVEKAFHTSMRVYRHPTEKRTFYSPDREPALALNVPVAHIAGLNNFSIPHPMVTKASVKQAAPSVSGSGPDGAFLGSDMRAAYYGGTALTGSGQTVGLFELGGYNLSDVDMSFSSAGQSYSVPINNVLLDGADAGPYGNYDVEQVSDIVQAIGMAPGLSQVRVYIGNYALGNDEVSIFNAMATENIAKQLSCSWLWTPDDPETDEVFFEEFAAQGQTLFTASGDWGAFPNPDEPYYYPGEDPLVTAVGGTTLTTNGAGGSWASETAWLYLISGYASGGGISPDGIPIPSWQAGVANSSNGGSTTLRNVPDVAMESDFDTWGCAIGGTGVLCDGVFSGTSLSAPRWAGFLALVNQQAASLGSPPLGFINPAIYAIGQGPNYDRDFHDVTTGNNNCCGQSLWFSAAPGYDLVTGWGSPNGQNLINDLAGGFTLSASPGSVTVPQGGSGTTTIRVMDEGGFTGNVQLAASGLPSGVTASFATNPTNGMAVLTLAASGSASPGSATVTITGTAGDLSETATVVLTVSAASVGVSVSPSSLSLSSCGTATATIAVTGFPGAITPTLSGLPKGVTASLSPGSKAGSSLLTLTAGCAVLAGSYTVTITVTSGNLTASTSLHLQVNSAAKSFVIRTSPSSLKIARCSSGTSLIIVRSVDGFDSPIRLSATGLPRGVTARFSRHWIDPRGAHRVTSALWITASSKAAIGSNTVTVTGTSGSISESADISLKVEEEGRHRRW